MKTISSAVKKTWGLCGNVAMLIGLGCLFVLSMYLFAAAPDMVSKGATGVVTILFVWAYSLGYAIPQGKMGLVLNSDDYPIEGVRIGGWLKPFTSLFQINKEVAYFVPDIPTIEVKHVDVTQTMEATLKVEFVLVDIVGLFNRMVAPGYPLLSLLEDGGKSNVFLGMMLGLSYPDLGMVIRLSTTTLGRPRRR